MKLTPLGKLLIFLVGLGLVLVAVRRVLPPELSSWDKLLARVRGVPSTSSPSTSSEKREPRSTPSREAGPSSNAAGVWVRIPGGQFQPSGGDAVDLAAFSLQRSEVTNADYQRFLDACPVGASCGPRDLPSYWDDAAYLETHRDYPVVGVSWGDASAYCKSLEARLPTAVEWERAAAGSDGRGYPGGGVLDRAAVNLLGPDRHDEKNRAAKQIATWPVNDARYARDQSPYGILGMAGNVSEWTASASPDEPDLRLVAGGSFDSWDVTDAAVDHRIPKNPTDRSSSVGIRCAKSGG
jgi:formylglycine-generating enzyme required for sulfatase activity